MRLKIVAIALLASAALACSRSAPTTAPMVELAEQPPAAFSDVARSQDAAVAGAMAGDGEEQDRRATNAPTPGAAAAPVLYLAYAYQMALEAPAERIPPMVAAHADACRTAGVAVCQLIASSVTGDTRSTVTGQVTLRAEPAWLRRFRAGVQPTVAEAGGRITSESTTAEDLTRQIVDTEAMLRARRTLRDRLQTILANRPGRVSDLLEVERELARVQSEIDMTESNLAVMRTRVNMSELSIAYASAPRPVSADTFEPLRQAFAGFLGNLAAGLGMIITLVAVAIPWAFFIAALAWIVLAIRRARGGRLWRRAQPPASGEPPPPAN